MTGPPTRPPPKPDSTVPAGTVINNNYVITELMSVGGMGEVFRGENTFTGDPVAIKIVLKDLAHDDNIATLFRREAKVLCGLSHDAIVRYFNFVRDEALDRYCLIMEFVDGRVLSDHVRQVAPLEIEAARRLMRRIAGGLEKVHEQKVIHRDLSPDNIILRDNDIDKAVLIDFGIARSLQMTDQTLHGQLAGKFKFISPEQLGHHNGVIGPQTDVYGLALMVAYAVQGGPLPMGDTVVEAVNARRAIPDLRHFDPRVRALLAHMLEPDPADRPATMGRVIELIDHPERMPDKYRVLGPKIEMTPAREAEMAAVFAPPRVIPGVPEGGITPREDPAAGWAALRWLGVVAVLGGIAAFVLTRETETPPAAVQAAAPEEVTVDDTTRTGFLATYAEGCAVAQRIGAGPEAGTVIALAEDTRRFDGLIDAYEGAFGTRPATMARMITPAQCAVAEMTRALAARDGGAPVLSLDSDTMPSDGTLVGRVSDRRGRPVWLALVTAAGGVYALTDRLVEQPDGSATFSFGLTADGDVEAQPQVLIALASDAPLIAAAAATDGTDAAALLPLIEAEIAGRDGRAGVALGWFELVTE